MGWGACSHPFGLHPFHAAHAVLHCLLSGAGRKDCQACSSSGRVAHLECVGVERVVLGEAAL